MIKQMNKRHGFTLIEIIVVISIISVLMTILIPVLSSIKKQARSTKCQANIREIGLLIDLYQTNNNSFPHAVNFCVPYSPEVVLNTMDASVDWPGNWWFALLGIDADAYNPEKSILQCPAKNFTELKYKHNIFMGNYGLNWSVCPSPQRMNPIALESFTGYPKHVYSLKHPSRTLLLSDSGYMLMTWYQTLPDTYANPFYIGYEALNQGYIPGASVNSERTLWPVQEDDALKGRHPGKTVNCLFADGHIENKRADDLVVIPYDRGQYGNLTPLWKP